MHRCGLKLNNDDRYAQPSHFIGGPGMFEGEQQVMLLLIIFLNEPQAGFIFHVLHTAALIFLLDFCGEVMRWLSFYIDFSFLIACVIFGTGPYPIRTRKFSLLPYRLLCQIKMFT